MNPQPQGPVSESMRWPLGIALGFCFLFAVNAAYIWTAIHVDDPVDPTYKETPR